MSYEAPSLIFVFSEDAEANFFQSVKSPKGDKPRELFEAWDALRKDRKTLRALCIFLLLAKHRSELWAEATKIRFDDKATAKQIETEGNLTWVNTLAVKNKEWRSETYQVKVVDRVVDLFRNGKFFDGKLRGPVAKGAKIIGETSVEYFVEAFSPKKLEFWIVPLDGAGKREKLEGDRLAEYALRLELWETDNRKRAIESGKKNRRNGWLPLVEKLIAETKRFSRPQDNEARTGEPSAGYTPSASVFLQSPLTECLEFKGDVGKALEKRMANPRKGETWFLINIHPSLPFRMKELLPVAITDHEVNIRWAFHSAAGKNCRAITAQWKVFLTAHGSTAERLAKFQKTFKWRREELLGDFGRLQGIDYQLRRKRLKFYESHVVHHFSAILFMHRRHALAFEDPPSGTACFVNPLPMQEMRMEKRCGIYLEGPSPMLSFYYHAIQGLFGSGIDDGYLTPFSLGRD